jgi:hypothetical protein
MNMKTLFLVKSDRVLFFRESFADNEIIIHLY